MPSPPRIANFSLGADAGTQEYLRNVDRWLNEWDRRTDDAVSDNDVIRHRNTLSQAYNLNATGGVGTSIAATVAFDDTVTVPTGKQLEVLSLTPTVTLEGTAAFRAINGEISVYTDGASSNAYYSIVAMRAFGGGNVKPVYSRVEAQLGFTGTVVAGVFATKTNATTGAAYCLQLAAEGTSASNTGSVIVLNSGTPGTWDNFCYVDTAMQWRSAIVYWDQHASQSGGYLMFSRRSGATKFAVDSDGNLTVAAGATITAATGGILKIWTTSASDLHLGTAGAVKWVIADTGGHLVTDATGNNRDIGLSASNQPRDLWLSRDANIGRDSLITRNATVGGTLGITGATTAAAVTGTVVKATTSLGVTLAGSQDASAALQVDSTTKGLLVPRMTNTQIHAISSPAQGLLVYDTDNNVLALNAAAGTWYYFAQTALP
jgi:hypothetical protein